MYQQQLQIANTGRQLRVGTEKRSETDTCRPFEKREKKEWKEKKKWNKKVEILR